MKSKSVEQMELGFNASKLVCRASARDRRLGRAAWWFHQMRATVNRALDWHPPQPARPEQIWLGHE